MASKYSAIALTTSATPTTAVAFTATSALATKALVFADAANTAAVTFGPDTNANARSVKAGEEYAIELPPGKAPFDLADWSAKSGDASQKLNILYV